MPLSDGTTTSDVHDLTPYVRTWACHDLGNDLVTVSETTEPHVSVSVSSEDQVPLLSLFRPGTPGSLLTTTYSAHVLDQILQWMQRSGSFYQ